MLSKSSCFLVVCLTLSGADTNAVPSRAANAITPEGLLKHIRVLASDEFEGRAPGTPGEQKSLDYIIAQCRAMKLAPGNPDGTWLQKVTLWGITPGGGEITLHSGDAGFPVTAGQDYRVTSSQPKTAIDVADSPIVFVGYGIVAPEYQWDDYKGTDVKGKAVVILAGDPPIPDPSDPSKLDPKMFLGPELSFYGRAGTKADIAWAHGATAVITLTGGAGRGGGAARGGGRGPVVARESMILRDQYSTSRIAATVALNTEKATELFSAGGQDLAALRKAALSREFHPVAVKASIAVHAENRIREVDSANVVAKITGSDPRLRDEYVIYSGHWDHLGRQGDNIFHGASDNASGTAGRSGTRSCIHRTSHEAEAHGDLPVYYGGGEGLLGAKYYVQNPLYPLASTAANINLDYFSNWGWGKTKDFSILGVGMSSLDDLVKDAVTRQGRVVTGDTDPSEGFYWRSDHVEFAMGGVPSLASSPGIDFVGKPEGYGEKKRAEYIRNDYHKVSDLVKPDWDLTGAVEDLRVLLEVGYRVAQDPQRPVWRNRGAYMHNPHAGK